MQDNLFRNLHALNTGWDEDFLTESFAYLLRYLLQSEPTIGNQLLRRITGDRFVFDDIEIGSCEVRTQVDSSHGTPDLLIDTCNHLICVEVKVDSDFAHDQLLRYRRLLDESGRDSTILATLTRYPHVLGAGGCQPDETIRWYEIADILEQSQPRQSVGKYLIVEFVEFLKHRGIAMEAVSWELVPGLKSLQNLLTLIAEVMNAIGVENCHIAAGQHHHGFRTKVDSPHDKSSVFFGIYVSDPSQFIVQIEYVNFPNDQNVELGKIVNGQWQNSLNLASEEIHFFALSKASQLTCFEGFFGENFRYAVSLIKSTTTQV